MGKKSRRQKQPAAEPYKYHHRFHHNSIMRHEDGSELSEAEEKQLATFFLQVRSTVDATHARSMAPRILREHGPESKSVRGDKIEAGVVRMLE